MPKRTSASATTTSLPEDFRTLFWDHDFDTLDLRSDTSFIISRVLTMGSWASICWLRSHVGDDTLRDWIEKGEGRRLDPKQLRFWELILGIPRDLVDKWLEQDARQTWDGRVKR